MEPVYLESPYAGDVGLNVCYARACMHDCLARGEAPFASHLLYTQEGILDDQNPRERTLGIESGFAWASASRAKSVFYVDLGVSRGMVAGIERARHEGRAIEVRRLSVERLQQVGIVPIALDLTPTLKALLS